MAAHSFPLLASSNHSFAVVRRFKGQYALTGIDAPVSWSAVRSVVFRTSVSGGGKGGEVDERCPICLDAFLAGRITKCGHVFCLPCLIRHAQTSAAATAPTCPCCAALLCLDDVRPVQIVTSLSVVAPGARLTLVKLHRVKGCGAPYLPQHHQPKRSAPSAAPQSSDRDAVYAKFHYVDPDLHLQHLRNDWENLTTAASAAESCLSEAERVCLVVSLDFVMRELRRWEDEASEERQLIHQFASPNSGMYQPQPRRLCYEPPLSASEGLAALSFIESNIAGPESNEEGRLNASLTHVSIPETSESSSSPLLAEQIVATHPTPRPAAEPGRSRLRADSVASIESKVSCTSSSPTDVKLHAGGSMYLDDSDECAFYQAEDGALCFLSAFNMRCLQAEYALHLLATAGTSPRGVGSHEGLESSTDAASSRNDNISGKPSSHNPAPLPDVVEGRVLEVEHVTLTPQVRNRLRFLEHLPLYTDVCLVELGLGHLICKATKKQFQAEFVRRQQARSAKVQAERREDRREQLREEQRVQALKERYRRVDPNDEFFHVSIPEPEPNVLGEEFGPNLTNHYRASMALPQSFSKQALNFSQAARRSGTVLGRAEDFPALGAAPAPAPAAPGLWKTGPPPKSLQPELSAKTSPSTWGTPSTFVSQQQTVGAGSELTPPPGPILAKRSGGKKIVLLSTGGHRGLS